jgi:hypothetical protein
MTSSQGPPSLPPIARSATVTAAPILDAAGRIDEDLPCRKCGYNLRGLLPNGICPECSSQVTRSLQDDRLSLCNPIWVRTLASGTAFVALGVTIFALDFISSALGFGKKIPSLARFALVGGWMIATTIGFWRVTTPEPWKPVDPKFLSDRKLARYVAPAIFVTLLSWLFVSRSTGISFKVIYPFAAFEVLVLVVSGMHHLRRLAQRIPDFAIARWLGIIKWITVGLVGMGLIGYAVELVNPANKAYPATSPTVQNIGCALACGFPAVLLWFVSVFVRLWIAIRDEARLAAAQWDAKLDFANPQSPIQNLQSHEEAP